MVNEELRQELEQDANESVQFTSSMTTLEQLTSGQDIYGEGQSYVKQISEGLTGYNTVEEALARGNLTEDEVIAVKNLMLRDIRRQELSGKPIQGKHYKLITQMATEGGKASLLTIMTSGSKNAGFWETFVSGITGRAYRMMKQAFSFGKNKQSNEFQQQ